MGDSAVISGKLVALRKLGVGEFAHLNGNLETHLRGTHELLVEWENPAYVCDAGLFHAVYGTQPMARLGVPHRAYSPSDRPAIREVIGEESERLVYLYGACDRDYFYPRIGSPEAIYRDRFTGETLDLPRQTMRDLLELTMANELEICIAGPAFREAHREGYIGLFERFEGIVSAKAFGRYREVFAPIG